MVVCQLTGPYEHTREPHAACQQKQAPHRGDGMAFEAPGRTPWSDKEPPIVAAVVAGVSRDDGQQASHRGDGVVS